MTVLRNSPLPKAAKANLFILAITQVFLRFYFFLYVHFQTRKKLLKLPFKIQTYESQNLFL